MNLVNRVAIVTGGTSGIGKAITKRLLQEGAKVYVIGRSQHDINELVGAIFKQGDVTDYVLMSKIIHNIGEQDGIDILVNNAGVTIKKRAEKLTVEEFDWVQKVNVTSVFNLSRLVYPYLKASSSIGRIINISSMAGHFGFSEVVPYCASKSAVIGLTRALATEWRHDNILVNSVAPGWFPSKITNKVMDKKRRESILNQIGLERFGEVEEIGNMVAFLCSNQATYITGQDFAVDGGALTFGY